MRKVIPSRVACFLAALLANTVCVAQGAPLKTEVGLGFPSLIGARVQRSIHERTAIGIGVGVLPLSWLITTLVEMPSTSVSERYALVYDPRLDAINPSIHGHFHPWESDVFLRLELGVLIAAAGGTAYLKNLSTGMTTNVAQVEGTLFMPRCNFLVGKTLIKRESYELVASLGISVLLEASLSLSVTGAMPAYLDVVPEARPTIQSGLETAESELTRALNDTVLRNRFLPAVSVHAVW